MLNGKDLVDTEGMPFRVMQPAAQRKSHRLISVAGKEVVLELCMLPSVTKSCIPWVMNVFSKNELPSPSEFISSSSCSIWSLSLTERAFGWSSQASRIVFMFLWGRNYPEIGFSARG